ncbi:unnamed protein product [Orchesella dallaii]|uniref:Chromo domain-containing protein n=1 Tax=Orchesella dallaii TaxID=48710 RepID=A0ABP1RX31_9HEXA
MARAGPKSKKRPAPKSKKEEKKEEVVDVSEDEQLEDVDNGNNVDIDANNDSEVAEEEEEEVDEPPAKKGRGRPAAKASKKTAPAKKAAKGRASSAGRKSAPKKVEESDDDDDDEEYEVEKVIDMRKRKGGREFLIKWKGYSKAKATWEPEDNLSCDDLIKEFEEKAQEKKDQPTRNLRAEPKETDRYVDTADLKYEGRKRSSNRLGKSPRKTYREPEDD